MRHGDPLPLEPLQPIFQHRAVHLPQDVEAHLDHEIRAHAEDVSIKGRMVELAERQAVRHDGLSFGMAIGQDVGGFQEFGMSQAADRALRLVGPEHSLPEAFLMETPLGEGGDVLAAGLDGRLRHLLADGCMLGIIDRHAEAEVGGIIIGDVHRPHGEVLPRHHPEQIDQRDLALHGKPQSHVVTMGGISSSIAVEEEAARSHTIFVGGSLSSTSGTVVMLMGISGRIAGLKMPWGPMSGTRVPLKVKPVARRVRGQDTVRSALSLLREEGERGQPNPLVELVEVERTLIHSHPPPQGKRMCNAMQ